MLLVHVYVNELSVSRNNLDVCPYITIVAIINKYFLP